ncbi:hypothetical protein AVEN_251161-1 [Araneus ventricosus]|uniref:Uncharacterized protein n=1 Tax=Araneus ventricosus TaxID=182803 RepID=A0A4Y2I7R2_ARAVE|nr:hypothetical protein AVEN_251161-1 [Araneus ventricosus]
MFVTNFVAVGSAVCPVQRQRKQTHTHSALLLVEISIPLSLCRTSHVVYPFLLFHSPSKSSLCVSDPCSIAINGLSEHPVHWFSKMEPFPLLKLIAYCDVFPSRRHSSHEKKSPVPFMSAADRRPAATGGH